jgi:multiple sugar transport system ATP-binding protein
VFLMDEPLSNLDAKLRVQTRTEISKLHQRLETTFIYVTHDQTEAMTMGSRIAVMRDGVLQQLDTPQNLYDCPANTFVAGFIGSPAMNFFDVAVGGSREDLYLDAGTFRLPVPADVKDRIAGYAGKTLVMGIRPEDIHDRDFVPGGLNGSPIKSQVDVMEPMGAEIYLYLLSGSKAYTARVDPRSQARPGKEVDMVVNLDRLHLFDKQTEQALR